MKGYYRILFKKMNYTENQLHEDDGSQRKLNC